MRYELIVPSLAETAITGLIIAGEKTVIRNGKPQTYRVEAYRSGLRLFKDGKQLRRWDDLNHIGRTIAHEIANKAKEIAALQA